MENRKYICSSCEAETQDTVWHHIVPKASGGLDNPGNLIELCLNCHSKVHNKNFVEMRNLQKEGIERAKKEGKYKGRKPKYTYDTVYCLFVDFFDGRSPTEIASDGLTNGENISRASIYRILSKINISIKDKKFIKNKTYYIKHEGLLDRFNTIEQVMCKLSNLSIEQIQEIMGEQK